MSDDLVKRLRDHIAVTFDDRGHVFENETLCDDAADRIEALEAEVGRVKVLEDVLREIANGAFNDNGGVTMDHGHMIRAFFKARAALEGEE